MKEPKYRQSEKEFLAQIIELAHTFNWEVAHFRPALTSKGWRTPVEADGAGFPDTVIAKEGCKPLFWEVKSEEGKVNPKQQHWIDITDGRVVRPSDWDEIVQILKGERKCAKLND